MMRPNVWKAIGGGAVGTLAMTVMMYSVAPMMLGRPMDVAAMLGSLLGGSWAMGMLMHVLNGAVIFPLIYAYLLYQRLSGEAWVRGTVWGLVLWFVSQALVIAHAIYGTLLGGIAGAATHASMVSRAQVAH